MIYRQKGVHHLDPVPHGQQDKNEDSSYSWSSTHNYCQDKDKMVGALCSQRSPSRSSRQWKQWRKTSQEATLSALKPLHSSGLGSFQLCLSCVLLRARKGWAAVGEGQRYTVGPGNFPEENREQNDALVA